MDLIINTNDVKNYIKIRDYILKGKPVYSKDSNDPDIITFQKTFTRFYSVRCKNDWFYKVFEEIRMKKRIHERPRSFFRSVKNACR